MEINKLISSVRIYNNIDLRQIDVLKQTIFCIKVKKYNKVTDYLWFPMPLIPVLLDELKQQVTQ